ncbi:MAG: C4-dicarboxylate ABC transporter substrate-binding protein [Desulfobacteraceae bacterium]|nr:MAG: C4-dicarboxylate ABC transporter substrate-binding protein [Desulfobacteraceae bacterium]
MKKGLLLFTVAAAVFSAAMGLLTPAPSTAGPVTLSYSNFFPPTHIQSQLAESWCKEVEKRTEGRVKVQYFAGQTLTKANQTYDSVLGGIADIGFSAFAYTRGRFPLMGVIDMPLGYPTGVAATEVANAVYKRFKPKELDNTQLMYLHAHGPGMVHTRSKPIRTIEDFKGLKIRSTGISAEVVSALGGTPVPMSMPESYQSLQKGVVDGSVHPLESNKGWNLGEVVRYVTLARPVAYTTAFFVVMNKDKWSALDEKDQRIISAINDEWALKHGQAWDSSDAEGKGFFIQKGNNLLDIDAKEAARWEAAVAPMVDAYAQKLDGDGLNGKAVVEMIRQMLKKSE